MNLRDLSSRSAIISQRSIVILETIGILGLYFLSVTLLYHHLCACDIFTEPILFRTESALFYRYTAMVVEQGYIPWYDTAIQHPEGMAVYRETPLLMEYVVGYLYRFSALFFPDLGLQAFITLFKINFTSVSIIPTYMTAKLVGHSRSGAFIATLMFVVSPGFYSRVATTQSYLLEHFALPFLFLSLALLLHALRNGSCRQVLSAGCVMAIAVASWQIPQFFLMILLGYFCLKVMWSSVIPKRQIIIGLLYVIPTLLIGIWLPFVDTILVLPLALLTLTLGFVLWVNHRLQINRPARVLLLGGIFGGLWLLTSSLRGDDYTHVYSLIYYKLRFLGQKPIDPALLPYDVRVYWTAGYRTPGLEDIVRSVGAILVASAIPFVSSIRQWWHLATHRQLLLYLTICFLILYLLMSRMAPFLTFFMGTMIAGLTMKRPSYLVVLVVLIGVQGWVYVNGQETDHRPYPARFEQLILNHTEPDDVILAEFYQSPSILAYYDRAINIHAIFENANHREKVKAYYFALAGTEAQFHQYARQVDANYFLFEPRLYLHTHTNSLRYYTDTIDSLPTESALNIFIDLTPETPYFRLVANSPYGALYQVK